MVPRHRRGLAPGRGAAVRRVTDTRLVTTCFPQYWTSPAKDLPAIYAADDENVVAAAPEAIFRM